MTAIKQTFDLINDLVEVSNLLVERVNGTAIHENGLLFINRLVKVTVNGQDAEFTKTVKLVPTTKLLDALNPAVYGLCVGVGFPALEVVQNVLFTLCECGSHGSEPLIVGDILQPCVKTLLCFFVVVAVVHITNREKDRGIRRGGKGYGDYNIKP